MEKVLRDWGDSGSSLRHVLGASGRMLGVLLRKHGSTSSHPRLDSLAHQHSFSQKELLLTANGCAFLLGVIKMYWKLDIGDGCTTLRMY